MARRRRSAEEVIAEYHLLDGLGQSGSEPVYARPIFWAALVGAVGLFVIFRRKDIAAGAEIVERKVSALVSDVERAIIKKFVPKGREGYIDSTFELGAKYGIDPYLLLGILKAEGDFGAAASRGEFNGHAVLSGDFIPRGADPNGQWQDKKGVWRKPTKEMLEKYARYETLLRKYPLPGLVKTYWERPRIGNLTPYKGLMWVPAYEARNAKFGKDNFAKSAIIPLHGGIGWGFTPWALDWGAYADDLTKGAAWDPDYATRVAIEKQIIPAIKAFKALGLSSKEEMIQAIVASYNLGVPGAVDAIVAGRKAGLSVKKALDNRTATSGYVDTVTSIARAANHEIMV